jgi:signal transduction histidine kinase
MNDGRAGGGRGRAVERPCGHRRPPERRASHGDGGRHARATAALAADNERLKAELHARLLEVEASRARIVEAGDRERRRVERNLHDGAQQRLVGLALALRLATRDAVRDPALGAVLVAAAAEVDGAISELRDLARGLHPAIVTDAGLGGAVETLAERPGIPVELLVDLPVRLPLATEICAYYVVAEALANANRHSAAERVSVRASVRDGRLEVVVGDDGRGGAVVARGSGLEGLADRVGALGGTLLLHSPPGRGTTLIAEIPLA